MVVSTIMPEPVTISSLSMGCNLPDIPRYVVENVDCEVGGSGVAMVPGDTRPDSQARGLVPEPPGERLDLGRRNTGSLFRCLRIVAVQEALVVRTGISTVLDQNMGHGQSDHRLRAWTDRNPVVGILTRQG